MPNVAVRSASNPVMRDLSIKAAAVARRLRIVQVDARTLGRRAMAGPSCRDRGSFGFGDTRLSGRLRHACIAGRRFIGIRATGTFAGRRLKIDAKARHDIPRNPHRLAAEAGRQRLWRPLKGAVGPLDVFRVRRLNRTVARNTAPRRRQIFIPLPRAGSVSGPTFHTTPPTGSLHIITTQGSGVSRRRDRKYQ